jgi:23S rRNA (uracil1939-C5)-methyltransferase
VADPRIVAALPACGRLVEMLASRKGEIRLSVTVSAAGLDVAVEGGKPLDGPVRAALGQFAGQEGLARLSIGGETVAMRRPPEQSMGRARVVPPPGGFLQATPEGEAALVAAVTEAVGPARRVADLFAGSGTFALPLAERAAVHAVEADAAALAALDAGWRRAEGLKPVSTERRDLFQRPLLAAEFKGFDAAVFDPPRAGAEAQAATLAKAPLSRLAAVSCNPATFARDARLLVDGGWRIDWVLPVDQFRWSPHVELVAAFRR